MANLKMTEEQFKKSVTNLGRKIELQKKYTNEVKDLRDKVKSYMTENNMDSFDRGKVHITCYEKTTSKMNEELVMEIIKKKAKNTKIPEKRDLILSAIKTVPVIDEDVLESLVYDGIITSKDLEPATTIKKSKEARVTTK